MTTIISVREAIREDASFVEQIMEEALQSYYEGDHCAHARRILSAHLQGGVDPVGHFSVTQKIFIATCGNKPAGMINVVGKKQGTFKISPLIVAQTYRGGHGVGSYLLGYAEQYAQSHRVRQIYCTVAEQNIRAHQFFLRKGYIVAGRSHSHYKPGVTETMMYKLFFSDDVLSYLDQSSISVFPFNEAVHGAAAHDLMLGLLPRHFRGVDENWVAALYAGYRRRFFKDVNVKYKLIYVAIQDNQQMVGVIGATPKKGQPIKIVPLLGVTPQAFAALVADIPQHLREYGHKLYTHLVPSVEEVMVLQRFGWSLDCMLPAAYHDQFVTQQWSYTYGAAHMRNMRVKNKFFQYIRQGAKDLEVRVGYDNIRRIQPNEEIRLATHDKSMIVRVKAIRRYQTFVEALGAEPAARIAPGCSTEELLSLLQRLYPPPKEQLGIYVLEIEPLIGDKRIT